MTRMTMGGAGANAVSGVLSGATPASSENPGADKKKEADFSVDLFVTPTGLKPVTF